MRWNQTAMLHDHLDGSRPLLDILPELHRLSGEKYRFDPRTDHFGQVQRWFKKTCHAGEWCDLPIFFEGRNFDLRAWQEYNTKLLQNVYTAVFVLGVDRLDHAVPLPYDNLLFRGELWQTIVARNIGVTGCPDSYWSSGLIPSLRYLRIRELLESGVLYSLNVDDDLFMKLLQEVFDACDAEYKFSGEEIRKLLRNPWLTRFGNRKQHMLSHMIS